MDIKEIILKNNPTLIDVREELELITEGSIEGAINIPLGEIEYSVDEIKEMPKPIVIFCRSGNRSGQAINYLESEGVTDLHNGMGYKDMKEILK